MVGKGGGEEDEKEGSVNVSMVRSAPETHILCKTSSYRETVVGLIE